MPVKLDHIHLHAADVEKTVAFYQKYFGAKEKGEFTPAGNRIVMMEVGGANVYLYDRACSATDPRPENAAIHHLGITVDDLDATAAALKAEGYEFTLEPQTTSTGSKMAFFLGPDNVCIEIIERP